MQKKLIALAIAGLSTAAFAQSNVTISGQMRVGFEGVSAGGATAANANLVSRTRVVDDNSNIKFAGEEALGNGTSAWFQFESAIGTDNNVGTTGSNSAGTRQTTIGSRNTAVGLKGSWGVALLGKWDAHYNSMASVEAAGLADGLALGASSLGMFQTVNGVSGAGGGRLDNVIAYVSPTFGGGFSALIAYSTSPTANETTAAGTLNKDNGWNLNLKYANGPIAVSYSHLAVQNAASATTDTRGDRLGAAYTFPMGFKIGLIWDKSRISDIAGAVTSMDRSAWALPLSYRTGAHNFSFTYAKANKVNTNAGNVNDSGSKMTMLGYEYSLSKRTSVSATYAAINNDAAATYDFWHPSSSVGAAAVAPAGADPRKLHFGVKHTF